MAVTDIIRWKIFTGLGIVLTLAAGGALAIAYADNSHLRKVVDRQDTLINDPATGYVAKLAQSETNTHQLKTAIESQRKAFDAKAVQDAAALAETKRLLVAAQTESRAARAAAAHILATPPQGATLEARMHDVDARILETLQ